MGNSPRATSLPPQSLPVFRSEQFIVVSGANIGDTLSFAEDLALDDVYCLEKGAPARLSILPETRSKARIAPDTEVGLAGICIEDTAFPTGEPYEFDLAVERMRAAADAAILRLEEGVRDIEFDTAHLAADVIFRTLFSMPITEARAEAVFAAFQSYQRMQPLLSPAALLGLWRFWPKRAGRRGARQAAIIRELLGSLVAERAKAISAGTAPNDLATQIMTCMDPETGKGLDQQGMIDQVAIFFLAGHETSASALAWTLYLLAMFPDWQDKLAAEAKALDAGCDFKVMSKLRLSRDVFREALRLYPPVPMMVRESTCPENFRGRAIKPGAQVVISPWHLHRHTRLWDNPDGFDPTRWATENGKQCMRDAFIPFSSGPRVCTGAGFAMVEGPLLLSMLVRNFRFETTERTPVPVAHLTVRSKDGIWLKISKRTDDA